MRKTFLTFCVAALSLLAVSSCGKIEDSLHQLEEGLANLTERVAALEKKLNDEVATLNSKIGAVETAYKAADADLLAALQSGDKALTDAIAALNEELDALDGVVDGYIESNDAAVAAAIADFTKTCEALAKVDADLLAALVNVGVSNVAKDAKGNVVITFTDKSQITIPANPATGIVTVVDGKWAVIVDGEVVELEALLHPDTALEFKVGEDNVLYVSYDGKKTWVATGAVVNDDTTINVVEAFEYTEGDAFVTLTVGGVEYQLPVYKADTASLVLGRADFFLRYEGTKKVELEAEGMAEYYVMSKPDGWKASIDGTTLTVTAPTKAAIKIGAAETVGEVLVHGTTAEGKCKVAKVEVTAGPGLTLSVDAKGNLTVMNAYSGEKVSMWGDVSYGFEDFIFGIATPEDFLADPAAYAEFFNNNWSAPNYMDPIFPSMYNVAMGGEYVEGEYEVDVIETTVSEVYNAYYWDEVPAGAHLVLWAAPIVPGSDGQAVVEDIVYAEYVNIVHEVEVTEVTHSDVAITATVAGASNYVIGCVAESYYNSEWNPMTFEDYMKGAMGGPWTGFVKYGAAEALGAVVPAEMIPAEFNLSDVLGEKLSAGENYKVWIMPIVDHKAKLDEANSYPEYDCYVYDYSAFDFEADFLPYVIDVKTNDLVAGGEYKAEMELVKNDFTSIYVNVTPSAGTESVYYYWYSEEDFEAFESDAEIMADLMENCYSPLSAAEELSKTYVNPGETYYLATVSIGTDGKYGKVEAKEFSTRAIPYDEEITVEVASCVLSEDGKTYTVTVNVTGATKVMGYNIKYTESNWSSFPKDVCKNGHKASYYGYQMAEVVDGQAVLTFSYSSYKNDYYVAAYNVEGGAVSAISAECAKKNLF